MPYFTVTTLADTIDATDGKLSLREAVAKGNATGTADTIVFAADIEGMTLTLTQGELVVTQDLAIDGDKNDKGTAVTIDGNDDSRILNITGGATDLVIEQLTLAHGHSFDPTELRRESGGAILLGGGSLTLTDCTVRDSYAGYYAARGDGGAIFASSGSRVTILDSSIRNNQTEDYGSGGGIATGTDVKLTVLGSDITANRAGRYSGGGALRMIDGGSLTIANSSISQNSTSGGANGGGILIYNANVIIDQTTISNNFAGAGGGISISGGNLTIRDSTIAKNQAGPSDENTGSGGGVAAYDSAVFIANSTITSNAAVNEFGNPSGGGVRRANGRLDILNSIIAGNISRVDEGMAGAANIAGAITFSNGHNVFGIDVSGNIAGDRMNAPPASVFAAIDPATGGGKLSTTGIVPLKSSLTNSAVSAADPLTASATGQLGTTPRPQPAGSLPDIGSVEIPQPLSTSPTGNNDVLTGSAAANNLAGLAGNDLIKGLGGNDTLIGNDGSDVLDGGPGNDTINGGTGVDLATYAGPAAVIVDLSGTADTAKRGGETDTLTGIQGAIGSSKADTFKGDALANEFQGGLGRDIATGGGERDLYDFNAVADSPPGAGRDVVTDFAPGQDIIDLAGIDADTALPGDQSFRWVEKATLTGAAQLGYFVAGANTIVRASTDADAAAELEIQLTGKKTLTAGDFVP